MPTQSSTYNSRVTDEALEKRFRDTFRSQGGAELVDDLYAQGVIVPVVDFTAAATGQQLAQNLQTAWDFSTGSAQVNNSSSTIITNAGFWRIDLTAFLNLSATGSGTAQLNLTDGVSNVLVWALSDDAGAAAGNQAVTTDGAFVVFVNSGQSVDLVVPGTMTVDIWYRQIATLSGDLVNPLGFTSS